MNAFLLYGYCETRSHVSGSAGLAEGPPVRVGLYTLTAAFPKQETYGLSLQMRRAAVSIPPTSLRDSVVAARRIRLDA